jgi:hypothetical protein
MKAVVVSALILGCVGFIAAGCDNKANKVTTPSGQGFELTNVTDQTIQQAETDTLRVAIDRKGGFDGELKVEVTGLPSGVTVEGGNTHAIMAKDTSLSLKLMASDSAQLVENHPVTVRVSANVGGQQLSKQDLFNLTVKAKKT